MQNTINKYKNKEITEFDNSVLKTQSIVSVMVITFNHKNYIEQCLDSILMQETNFQLEILLGEDDSTDGTREICIEYAEKFPDKIRLFLHHRENNIEINGKPTGRFNFLYNLYNARGKYIALCEGDDYWTDPYKLQKQVDFLEGNPDYNICFHKVKLFHQAENKFGKDTITPEVPETTNIEDLARGNFIHTPSVLLRNNFIIPKWFSKSPIGDWTLYMNAIKDKKIKKLDEVMAIYRVHNQGIWALKSSNYRILNTIKSIKLLINSKEIKSEVKKILQLQLYELKNRIPKKTTVLIRVINIIKRVLNE